MTKKIWTRPQSLPWSNKDGDSLSYRLGISPIVADILRQRGFTTEEEILEFLRPSMLNLNSPFAFREMAQAIGRLEKARNKEEKVLIYGDYDVDGVTGTALLYKVLTDLGFKAVAYIPSRMEEGYGLHKEAILKASQANVKLIITVDCGITAVDEIEYAKALGIDIILTDHHEPPAILPRAFATLNPKITDSGYPFRDLAGVGVAFKLAQALLARLEQDKSWPYAVLEILDLAALGTIADLVPLVGENRIIVASGLRQMENTIHLGLRTLLEECGLGNKPLKAGQIAFLVAPRINAAGRMDSARAGLELLLTGQVDRAKELARFLSRENAQRQETEKEILAQAVAILEKGPLPRVIVLSGQNWHHGVIGIVASRLVERYYRPVFLIAEEDDMGRGSARGIGGYHVLNELSDQAELMEKYGGHSQAAGFSLKPENIPQFREALNRSAEKFSEDMFYERIQVDRCIPLEALDASLMRELESLAPFGFGNPTPVLAGKGYSLYQADTVGKDHAHLKCLFGPHGEWEGVAFRKGEELEKIIALKTVDVAFGLDWNTFRGAQSIQMMIKDIQPEAFWQDAEKPQPNARTEIDLGYLEAAPTMLVEQGFENMDWTKKNREEWMKAFAQGLVHEDILKERIGFLTREDLVQMYRVLYDLAIKNNPICWQVEEIPLWQARTGIKIFEELGLVRCLRHEERRMYLEWIPATKKLNLEESLSFRTAKRRWEEIKETLRMTIHNNVQAIE